MSLDKTKVPCSVTCEEAEPCVKIFQTVIEASSAEEVFNQTLKLVSSGARVRGYRPGKAPLSMVRNLYGEAVNEQAASDLLEICQQRAFGGKEEELDAIMVDFADDGKPTYKPGEDFVCKFRMVSYPKIEVPDYSLLRLDVPKPEITDEDIDGRVERMREEMAEFLVVEDGAQDNDLLKVSYSSDFQPGADASSDVERLCSAENTWIWLHDSCQFPGAVEALKGIKAGESRTFESKFDDSRDDELAGKTVEYKFKVEEVQRRCPLSDEKLLERVQLESLELLRQRLRDRVGMETQVMWSQEVGRQSLDQMLVAIGNFDVPQELVSEEQVAVLNEMARGKSEDEVKEMLADQAKLNEDAVKEAVPRIRRLLTCRAIAKKEGINLSEQEIRQEMQRIAAAHGMTIKDLEKRMATNNGLRLLYSHMIADKVRAFLAGKLIDKGGDGKDGKDK